MRDNTGPLAKSCNLDKGLLVVPVSGTYRILITIRYGICICERLAENSLKFLLELVGDVRPKLRVASNLLIYQVFHFLLDRRI